MALAERQPGRLRVVMSLRRWADDVGTHTLRAAAFHAVFVGAVTVLKSATSAMFLAQEDVGRLPFLYVIVSVLMALTTALLAGPLGAWSPRRLLAGAAWIFAAITAVLCGAHAVGMRWAVSALYVLAELYGTALSILYWSTASAWFDARSSRRAFGVLSAGGMAGALVGGAGMRVLAGALGSTWSAVGVVVCTALAVPLLDARRSASTPRAAARSLFAGAAYLWSRPYPKAVALLAATFSALGACVDYVFRREAAERLSEIEIATLFGDLNAVVGLSAIAWQLLFTSRVLERGGVFVFIGIIPMVLAALAAGATFIHAFPLLVVMKGVEMAGSYSILQAGIQLLYNPIPAEFRSSVRAFIDGLVKKSGMAVAGMCLAVAVEVAPVVASPWSVVLLAVMCVLIIRWLRAGYLAALEEKLRGGRAQAVASVDVGDRATRQALLRTLGSTRGAEVLAAMAILRRDGRFDPTPHLAELLTHDDEAVRVAALELVPVNAPPQIEFVLASILSIDARRPRAAAVRALARSFPQRAPEVLVPYLEDADPGVACAVIAVLLPVESTRSRALHALEDVVARRSPLAAERRELARLLGEVDEELVIAELARLVADEDDTVRSLALQSTSRVFAREASRGSADKVMSLVDAVQRRLPVRADRSRARAALAGLGDTVVPTLRVNLDDRSLPLAVRIEIPRLLRVVGTAAAAEALLFSNVRDHPSLRYRIAEALFDLHRAHPGVALDADRVRAATRRRLEAFEHYRPLCRSLLVADATAPRGGPARRSWDLLRRVTTDRLVQNLEMALRLLGLLHGAERMRRACEQLVAAEREALAGAPPERLAQLRADALEVVDVALQGDPLHDDVMRLLEPARADAPATNVTFQDVTDTARTLRASTDPLVAAFARLVLRSGVIGKEESSLPRAVPESTPRAPVVLDPTDEEGVPSMDEATLGRIMALEKVDLFEGMAVDDLAAIASVAEDRHAGAGEVLYREGEPGDTLMVITSGEVTLLHGGRTVMRHGPGESIGQVSFLDRGPRPTTAVVRQDGLGADLLCLRNDAFMELLLDRPELNRGLFVVLARRLRTLLDMAREG